METKQGNVWFYIRNHQQHGPVGLFELTKMLEQGTLTGDSFIWMKDMDCWQMAKTIDIFHLPPDSASTEQPRAGSTVEWTEAPKGPYPNGRPFVRYLARFFDLSLFSFILITCVTIFSPKFIIDSSAVFIFILSLILYILVEAVILSIFGNTLGKALLNTRLKTVTGEPINFITALQRSIFVNAAGMGFGVPLINIICFLFSYSDLTKHGMATWDKQLGTVVLYGRVSSAKLIFVSLFPIALLIAGLII